MTRERTFYVPGESHTLSVVAENALSGDVPCHKVYGHVPSVDSMPAVICFVRAVAYQRAVGASRKQRRLGSAQLLLGYYGE